MASLLQCFVCGTPIIVAGFKPKPNAKPGMEVDFATSCRCGAIYEGKVTLKSKPEVIPTRVVNLPSR